MGPSQSNKTRPCFSSFWYDANATQVISRWLYRSCPGVKDCVLVDRFGRGGCLGPCAPPPPWWRDEVESRALPSHLAPMFCTLQQFHTDIDPLACQCKVTSIWRGWSGSGFSFCFFEILSSTTDLMIQFQLCYTSNSTWNGNWTQSTISLSSLCSVVLSH